MNNRSKKRNYLLIIPLILSAAFLSCAMPDKDPETGTLTITLPESEDSRAAFADYAATLRFFLSGAGPASFQNRRLDSGENRLFLTPGTWSLTLSILNPNNEEVDAQTKTITVQTGRTVRADFAFRLANPTETDKADTPPEGGMVIELDIDNDNPELLDQSARVMVSTTPTDFVIKGSGWNSITWYENGVETTNHGSNFAFYPTSEGIYTLYVVVTDTDGKKFSGGCTIVVYN